MSRRPEDVRAALARAAGLVAYDAAHTWRDVLFTGPDETDLSRPGDPDRALLTALTQEYPELDAHADTLPERAHLDWLGRILAIPRLPVRPDTVVAHATVDPGLAPAVVEKGTVLRGGKDAFGVERRYRTNDALMAHGATVTAVRSQVPGGHPTGLAGLVAEADPYPLSPTTGAAAPHRLRLYSPVLAFDGGNLTVRVTLTGATSAAGLGPAVWRYPRADGARGQATGDVTGNQVTVVLTGGCGLVEGATGDPWLEADIPPDHALPTSIAFTEARLQVTGRTPIVPQAAYLNDGALDVTKELQPFGPAARRGDALYLRSDEAFGKQLATVTVSIQVMQAGGAPLASASGGSGIPVHLAAEISESMSYLRTSLVGSITAGVQNVIDRITGLVSTRTPPHVEWQRRVDGEWQTFEDVGAQLTGFTGAPVSGAPCSEPAVVGGEAGHLVRAFLSEGDFGWTDYQREIATFATGAVAGDTPTMPTPPVPPIVSRITLSYTTASVAATKVEAVNGWVRTRQVGSGAFQPFTRSISPAGDTGMVALGLDLPAAAIGSSVSVYLGVDSASPCGSSTDPEGARWEWWDGAAWQPLPVADGSRLLRESGLLRFIAPEGWAVGCDAVSADAGRWVRMVTDAPERIGVVTSVTPDAVVATYASQALDPARDPSPATALPAGTIKGTLSPVSGVKKVTNLGGVRGRGPEDDASYRRRASALARHRGRAVTSWDYEEIVAVAFPEVAAVRCLPHTGPDGVRLAGSVGLVVLPDRPMDPQPRPSVSLAGRITDVLAPMTGLHAHPTVLCPLFAPVTVTADILLRRGITALTGRDAVAAALETWLHPGGTTPTRWGRSLFRSALAAFLDGRPEVDTVHTVTMRGPDGVVTELVEVDPCRGLFCSSAAHTIAVKEQL
ncbi:baseplate J/gp47 family protein [Geodermatophilus sp. CPCC 205761]|uniref:baseplate J/gp47 family protein n=1 Tax=Geodermatophilus sp. CPCC 205761 TaxID=2936597 RepID=UPI003EE9EADD